MDKDVALALHAKHHHGIFRVHHAQMAGLSRGQIEHRIEAGLWEQMYKDVFRLTGVPPTWYGSVLAACWAGGFRSAASHRCAAALFGLPGGDRRRVEIICPRWRRARHEGLVVHESKVLTALDMTFVHGIPVTTPARTLFDLGGVRSAGVVELALEAALRKGLVSIAELDATVRRLSRSGRPGGPVLRGLLDARAPERRPTESDMESRLVQAIRMHGLPEPVAQHEVWDGARFVARVDLAYPDARIAIEYDSDEFHTGRIAVDRDRSRRHLLLAAGWLTIEVGALDVRRGASGACSAIRRALDERLPGGFGVARSAGS
jgi:very-short-patch-repair endonuclease